MTHFARNLRYLRRQANLSQSDVGDRLGTDYNTISRYENGKSVPKLDALDQLARLFGVSLEQLRGEDLSATPTAPAQLPLGARPVAAPTPRAPLSRPARHPLTVSVELDGTLAAFERAVARLSALTDVVAQTD